MNPPSKQWPLVSIIARSVLSEVGYRTSVAEQLLSRMVAVRSAATAAGAAVVAAGAVELARAGAAAAGAKVMASAPASDRANIAGRRRMTGRDDIGAAPTIAGPATRFTNRWAATNGRIIDG